MIDDELKKQLQEAGRWSELERDIRNFVKRYGQPTVIQMTEVFGCGREIIMNVGDTCDGLQLFIDKHQVYRIRLSPQTT